ncbi:unnamed protein product [Taenia asiatica]|uniref:BHLH domain-containing protein n=1 Tax=Taenia asiatica TaxID=60517 RepID=A0A0R3VZ72_TAEAS|nr:unnamed protein product [Taenia asiatica]
MSECETKELDDDFGSMFDDLDIDSIPLFQTDFASDVDLDYLLTEQSDDAKSIRRSPHNAIERRYRQSINGKINELREILNASSGDDTKVFSSVFFGISNVVHVVDLLHCILCELVETFFIRTLTSWELGTRPQMVITQNLIR